MTIRNPSRGRLRVTFGRVGQVRPVDDNDPFAFASPNRVIPPRVARVGDKLFDFVRASDQALMTCELFFHGESYVWEAMFLVRGELFYSRRFETKAQTVPWAEFGGPRRNARRPSRTGSRDRAGPNENAPSGSAGPLRAFLERTKSDRAALTLPRHVPVAGTRPVLPA